MSNDFKSIIDNKEYKISLSSEGAKGTINDLPFDFDTIQLREGKFHALKDNKSYTIELLKSEPEEKTFTLLVNGTRYQVAVKDKYDDLLKSLGMDNMAARKINELKAPMPGLVLDIRVAEGQEIKKGDALIVLEAMKMENILKSPTDGKVKKISVQKSNAVEKGQVLIHFE